MCIPFFCVNSLESKFYPNYFHENAGAFSSSGGYSEMERKTCWMDILAVELNDEENVTLFLQMFIRMHTPNFRFN